VTFSVRAPARTCARARGTRKSIRDVRRGTGHGARGTGGGREGGRGVVASYSLNLLLTVGTVSKSRGEGRGVDTSRASPRAKFPPSGVSLAFISLPPRAQVPGGKGGGTAHMYTMYGRAGACVRVAEVGRVVALLLNNGTIDTANSVVFGDTASRASYYSLHARADKCQR